MQRFYADHYFHIGSMHYQRGLPCQDYALSYANSESAVAVVSDGCSSGTHTDLGSRIQVLTLLETIRNFIKRDGESVREIAERISEEKKKRLLDAKSMLGLSRSNMLATSLYAYISAKGGFVHIEGDGIVVRKYRDGSIKAHQYVWEDNTPYYPAYADLDLAQFVEAHGGNLDLIRLKRIEVEIRNGEEVRNEVKEFSLKEGLLGVVEEISLEELEELEFLLVSTDGAAQVEGLGWVETVEEFMAYKSLEGEFAKRRMIRALKTFEKEGYKPEDDVGIAVVRIHEILEDHVDKNDESPA
jgi:hypothetical protein